MSNKNMLPYEIKENSWSACTECEKTKTTRSNIPKKGNDGNKPMKVGERIVLDIWGPTSYEGPNKEKYALVIRDQYSGYITVFPLKRRSDSNDVIKHYINRFNNQTGEKIITIRFDNAK